MLQDHLNSKMFKECLSLTLKTVSNCFIRPFNRFFLSDADMLLLPSPWKPPDKSQAIPLLLTPVVMLLKSPVRSWKSLIYSGLRGIHRLSCSALYLKQLRAHSSCIASENCRTRIEAFFTILWICEFAFLHLLWPPFFNCCSTNMSLCLRQVKMCF